VAKGEGGDARTASRSKRGDLVHNNSEHPLSFALSPADPQSEQTATLGIEGSNSNFSSMTAATKEVGRRSRNSPFRALLFPATSKSEERVAAHLPLPSSFPLPLLFFSRH